MQTEQFMQVSRYAAGHAMSRHHDDRSRITFVLAGGFVEETARGSVVISATDTLIKPRDVAHENRFGPEGAELATIFLAEEDFPATEAPTAWGIRRDTETLSASLFLMEAAARGDRPGTRTALSSLLAGVTPSGVTARAKAPVWLRRMREELAQGGLREVDVAGSARAAGVHPVHASRLFARHYGQSVTRFAQGQAVRRAMGLLMDEAHSLATVAVETGFYDQSHMSRVFRRVLGRPPMAVRRACLATG